MKLDSLINSILDRELTNSGNIINILSSKAVEKLELETDLIEMIANIYGQDSEISLVASGQQAGSMEQLLNIKDIVDGEYVNVPGLLHNLGTLQRATKSSAQRALINKAIVLAKRLHSINDDIIFSEGNLIDILMQTNEITVSGLLERNINEAEGKQEIALRVQDTLVNKLRGISSSYIKSVLRRAVVDSDQQAKEFFDRVDVSSITSSPSLIDDMSTTFDILFLKEKLVPIKRNSRRAKKGKLDISSTNSGRLSVASKKLAAMRTKLGKVRSGTTFNLTQLRNLLNLKMHELVKDNMGRSSEPPVRLRYQTGRFAKSVKVDNIKVDRAGAIQIFYTYMRYPYDVFLPGGALHNPQRNPTTIIGKSIRGFLVELFGKQIKVKNTLV